MITKQSKTVINRRQTPPLCLKSFDFHKHCGIHKCSFVFEHQKISLKLKGLEFMDSDKCFKT